MSSNGPHLESNGFAWTTVGYPTLSQSHRLVPPTRADLICGFTKPDHICEFSAEQYREESHGFIKRSKKNELDPFLPPVTAIELLILQLLFAFVAIPGGCISG